MGSLAMPEQSRHGGYLLSMHNKKRRHELPAIPHVCLALFVSSNTCTDAGGCGGGGA